MEDGSRGSLGSGLSRVERDTDLLIGVSLGKESLFNFPIEMTGMIASFDNDTLRSRSFVIDRRTEPKPLKGLRDEFGEAEREEAGGGVVVVVAFLLGPKGRRERSERKEGIPEFGGDTGDDG